jgi:pimeloyl-ACP methyl ester carboxylesterase
MPKPVFVLFNGSRSSKTWWEYTFVGTDTLQKLDFLDRLKQLGDVYTFNQEFFNLSYYDRPELDTDEKKEQDRIWATIDTKHTITESTLDFTLKDLDYGVICRKVYADVRKKYGAKRQLIPVGHSYGGLLAMLFSKMYKKECPFAVAIDNPSLTIKYFIKFDLSKHKKMADTYFRTNDDLQDSLDLIQDKSTPKKIMLKEIKKVHDLISYKSALDKAKYFYNKYKLAVPTLIFKCIYPNPKDVIEKLITKGNKAEIEKLSDVNGDNVRFVVCEDADHYIWKDQKFSDVIINHIATVVSKL